MGTRPDTTSPQALLLWYELQPRAVPLTGDSVTITARVQQTPSQVQLNTISGFIPFTRQQDGTYRVRVAVSDLLFNYRAGDLRNTAAFIEVVTTALTHQVPLTVNVRDATVASVEPQVLSPTVQATSHVVNIRADSVLLGNTVPPSIIRAFYQFFPDEYDFINVLAQAQAPDIPFHYLAVRNDIVGLGLQIFERAENYGGENLKGILHFPNDALFDPAETSVLHELSHRWMSFSNLNSLRGSLPHFPISTMAHGITGYTIAEDPGYAIFRWQATPLDANTWSLTQVAQPRTYNDLELYLMGLLPPDSVGPHIVFMNQNQRDQLRHGGTLTGPTDTITVAEWIARDGARSPSYENSQKTFRMATIVLSRGRMLTRDEMAFYHAVAARGESLIPLPAILQTTRFTTMPFYMATGERGRLITRLIVPPSGP